MLMINVKKVKFLIKILSKNQLVRVLADLLTL